MRQMTPEFEEKPIEQNQDDRLEMKSLSRKDRLKYKKEKMKATMEGMSRSEKFKYLLYFYKEALIIGTALLLVAIILGKSIYSATRPITISYVVVNCGNQMEFNMTPMRDYAKSINKYDGYQIKCDTNVAIVKDEYSQEYENNANSQVYINFLTMCTSDYYDVVFTNKEGAFYCASQNVFYPLDKYLDAETYEKIKDRIYVAKDMNGVEQQVAIDISDTEFAKSMNLGYKDALIGFAGDQEDNHERVQEFLNYLFP